MSLNNGFNEPLARAVLEQIKAEPDRWNQSLWASKVDEPEDYSCGTAYCFAGWTCVIADKLTDDDMNWYRSGDSDYCAAASYFSKDESDQYLVDIAGRAQGLLGLSNYQANILFDGGNTFSSLERLVDHYSGPDLMAELELVDKLVAPELTEAAPVLVNEPSQVATD